MAKTLAQIEWPYTIKGQVHNWQLFPDKPGREYIVTTIPFGHARQILKVMPYAAQTGEGEQREMVRAHRNKLVKAMEENHFTPTAFSANLLEAHLDKMTRKNDRVEISIDQNNPLAFTDGQHREGAVIQIRDLLAATDEEAAAFIDMHAPFTIMIYLNPETRKEDFMNFQRGLAVKRAQMASMELDAGLVAPDKLPYVRMAYNVARKLASNRNSHLFGQVLFDSRGAAPLSINVLTNQGASIMGSTLYGGARLAVQKKKTMTWLVTAYIGAYSAFIRYDNPTGTEQTEDSDEINVPQLLSPGMVLSPTLCQGTKGGSMLMIGLGNMLAARMLLNEESEPSDHSMEWLVACAREVFNRGTAGNLSDSSKRIMLGEFARAYFEDIDTPKVDGVPTLLTHSMTRSAFNVPKEATEPAESDEVESDEEAIEDGESTPDGSPVPATAGAGNGRAPTPKRSRRK